MPSLSLVPLLEPSVQNLSFPPPASTDLCWFGRKRLYPSWKSVFLSSARRVIVSLWCKRLLDPSSICAGLREVFGSGSSVAVASGKRLEMEVDAKPEFRNGRGMVHVASRYPIVFLLFTSLFRVQKSILRVSYCCFSKFYCALTV